MSRGVEVSGGGGTGRGAPGTSKGAGQCPVCVNRVREHDWRTDWRTHRVTECLSGRVWPLDPRDWEQPHQPVAAWSLECIIWLFFFSPSSSLLTFLFPGEELGRCELKPKSTCLKRQGGPGQRGGPRRVPVRGSGAPCPSPAQGATPLLLPDLCFPPSNANPLGSERLASNPLLEACA